MTDEPDTHPTTSTDARVEHPHGDAPRQRDPAPSEDEVNASDPRRVTGRDEPHWFNIPNLLTFLRAALVPVILLLLTMDESSARWWAFGIFLFAAATDSVDGWVARRWHGETTWGQLADPIADKLLIIGSLASLAYVGELPVWAVIVIVAREIAVTGLRVFLVRRMKLVMPASAWGKAKTVSQVVAVAAFLLPGMPDLVALLLLYVAVLLTIWSGLEYAFRSGRLSREARNETEA